MSDDGEGDSGPQTSTGAAPFAGDPWWRRAALAGADAVATWLPWTMLIGVSPGIFYWAWQHPESLSQLADNQLQRPGRDLLRNDALISLGIVLLVYVAVAALRWQPDRGPIRTMRRLNHAFAWLIALPAGAVLGIDRFEVQHPYYTLLFAGIAGTATALSAAEWVPALRRAGARWLAKIPAWLGVAIPGLLVVMAAVAYAGEMIGLQLQHHHNLSTGAYDLGIYTNVLWRSSQGEWLACSFIKGGTHASAHFDPILILLSPAMWIHRGAETAIVIQAVWLASGALPIFLLGRRCATPAVGAALAVSYLLYPALHGLNLFDFHSLALTVVPLMWAVYFVHTESWRAYAVTLAVILLTREDQALQACCLALYAMVSKRAARAGVVTVVVAVLYLAVAKLVFMTDAGLFMESSERSYSYIDFFSAMTPAGGGAAGILETLVSNPTFVVQHALLPDRVLYALQLLVPLAFLPLFVGRRWVLAGYGITFLTLVSSPQAYTVAFHYSATLIPWLFMLSAEGAGSLSATLSRSRGWSRERVHAGLAAGILVTATLTSVAFGAFVPNETFRAGWYRVERAPSAALRERWRVMQAIRRDIPADASVCGSGFTVSHFAAREHIHHLPDCEDAEWVVSRTDGIARHESNMLRGLRASGDYREVRSEAGLVQLQRVSSDGADEEP